MGFVASLFIVYGVAGVVLGVAVAIAIGRCLHHRRRSQIAAYARSPSASPGAIREGFALLRGEVSAEDAAPGDAVIAVEIPCGGHLGPFRAFHASVLGTVEPTGSIDIGPAALALFFVGAAALTYRTLAEQTSPWIELRVDRSRAA
ncbi:hypothetical protein [Sorangium atrum]|uniref:Uncharacterized protein n=1 Tax=Sorangium atrum TaxID=2995308 RepID=A0ABT5BXG6_9BACT|nr:hypothetical protein [Sorangium aterium]MDC0678821.1 hypothetical protein [Sorangium aterium]